MSHHVARNSENLPDWRPILLDGYLPGWADAVRAFYEVAIRPTCVAVAERLEAKPRRKPNFEMSAWEDERAIQLEVHRSFALSLGALWERNFRRHLMTSASIIGKPLSETLRKRIQGGNWNELCEAFDRVRGFRLEWFPQYENLYLLNLLASAIRHGDGKAAETLSDQRPDLFLQDSVRTGWFAWFNGEYLPGKSVNKLDIPLTVLSELAEAVATFWDTAHALSQASTKRNVEGQTSA